MRSTPIIVLAVSVASITSCDVILPADGCSAVVKPAVSVRVQDSASGALVASGTRLIARDGAYTDSSTFPANHPELDSSSLEAAGERAGTYSVTVRKAGYRDWTRDNVVASKGECHVNTVALTAVLTRI
jgi:hypothetical protein